MPAGRRSTTTFTSATRGPIYQAFDTLRRFLKHIGYDVTFVQNFTDIDDKMIRRAHEENTTVDAIAEKYIAEYFKDA